MISQPIRTASGVMADQLRAPLLRAFSTIRPDCANFDSRFLADAVLHPAISAKFQERTVMYHSAVSVGSRQAIVFGLFPA